jgi:hypothetical protein
MGILYFLSRYACGTLALWDFWFRKAFIYGRGLVVFSLCCMLTGMHVLRCNVVYGYETKVCRGSDHGVQGATHCTFSICGELDTSTAHSPLQPRMTEIQQPRRYQCQSAARVDLSLATGFGLFTVSLFLGRYPAHAHRHIYVSLAVKK